ncbi:hypothetical protein VNO77_07320 [Canavalia gladiata]|uniref:Uncharacterized protein n=1 Tax=Canavalia gladiata TaxID=3824 RepID=A0AAN9MD14_CANGL
MTLAMVSKDNYTLHFGALQFDLPVTWSYGKKYEVTLEQLSLLWSKKPATFVGLESKSLFAYVGRRLSGKVLDTFITGNLVFKDGKHAATVCGVPILSK